MARRSRSLRPISTLYLPYISMYLPISPHISQAVTLSAPSALAEGEQLYITYRCEGNAKLLLDYGFAEEI